MKKLGNKKVPSKTIRDKTEEIIKKIYGFEKFHNESGATFENN